jgi:hypothetical protein
VTGVSRKPALFAGFLLVTAALMTSAQDYVDVEAERRAADAQRRAEEAERRAEEAQQSSAAETPIAPVSTAPPAFDLLRYSTLLWDDNCGASACRRHCVTHHWR